jgi:hypothetical protein
MRTIVAKLIVGVAITAIGVFGADNSLGTWKLITEKSKYTPAPFPIRSLTVVREASGGGAKVTTTGEQAGGTAINATYTTKYDGSASSVTGANPLYDTISVKQVDANTLTDKRKKNNGSYQATGRTVILGGTMTVTTKGVNADGKHFVSVLVFEKQ